MVLDPAADDFAHHHLIVLSDIPSGQPMPRQVMLACISDLRSRDGSIEEALNAPDPPGTDVKRVRQSRAKEHRQQGNDSSENR
jgi:hypothetical protein